MLRFSWEWNGFGLWFWLFEAAPGKSVSENSPQVCQKLRGVLASAKPPAIGGHPDQLLGVSRRRWRGLTRRASLAVVSWIE